MIKRKIIYKLLEKKLLKIMNDKGDENDKDDNDIKNE